EIPCDHTNLIFRAFRRLAGENCGENPDLELEIRNEIPLRRGLGSSAAAVVAGLALGNEYAGCNCGTERLIQLAAEMEGHPDNVAAAVRGGLVVSGQTQDGSAISLSSKIDGKLSDTLKVVVVIPDFRLSTEAARAALPAQCPRLDAVFNVQRTALLLT